MIISAGRRSASLLSLRDLTSSVGLACSGGSDLLKHLNTACTAIVCDLHLPDMTAMELLKTVRQQSPNMTFVVCVEPDNLREALLAMMGGASGFLTTQQSSGAVVRDLKAAQIRQSLVSALAKATSHKTRIRISAPHETLPASIHRKGVHAARVTRTAVAN